MFGDFDKKRKTDVEFQNFKFVIRGKNLKEIFDLFYVRFIVIIALFNISEKEKIGHLRKFIANRLKYRILDYSNSTLYRELVIRLRQVDLNIRLIDK